MNNNENQQEKNNLNFSLGIRAKHEIDISTWKRREHS